jgi:hypothetical protein
MGNLIGDKKIDIGKNFIKVSLALVIFISISVRIIAEIAYPYMSSIFAKNDEYKPIFKEIYYTYFNLIWIAECF